MKTTWFGFAALGIVLVGCAAVINSRYNYDVMVKNTGTQPIPSSTVTSASGFWHQPGYLVPGSDKSIAGPFKYPYGDKWTVSWQTDKGEKFEKTLDLTKAFLKRFEGRLVFTINATNGLGYYTTNFPGQ
jgi:hypothetical protein